MAFKKMVQSPYPSRLWTLVGHPGSGKSTFATQMRAPMVVVDADHRFQEVLALAAGEVLSLSETAADNVDTNRIAALLAANMPGSGVKTIVVDSLTAIITPLVVQAMVDKERGESANLMAGFTSKALAMRQLQDAVTRWGCDALWIYHLQAGRDAHAKAVVTQTISETERARLLRSINLQLEVVPGSEGRRGIHVVWARRGRCGATLWDETGCWEGMPARIESEVYDGLSAAEQDEIERAPAAFPNPETAVAWAMERGAFTSIAHARNAYDKVKREGQPGSAVEMAALWVADVERRVA